MDWGRPTGDFWVFAYGSLIWQPDFAHAEAQPALLGGYHRALCISSVTYRGTRETPGLVFGLDRGGACRGMAFRIAEKDVDAVARKIWEREMVTEVYRPRWLQARLPQGRVPVWAFVADRGHEQYVGRLSDAETVRLILQGHGRAGPCLDYVTNTFEHLEALGIHDRALARLCRMAAAAQGEDVTS